MNHIIKQKLFSHFNQAGAIRSKEEEEEFRTKTFDMVEKYSGLKDELKNVSLMLGDNGRKETNLSGFKCCT